MKFSLQGAVGYINIEMELVSRVVVGVMYWNKKCCDFQYHNSPHSRFNAWQALAKTNFHYWMDNLSCAPSPIVPDLPQWVYESIIYEPPEMMGLGVGTHPADLPFFPPSDYVRLYDKLKMAAQRGFVFPDSWEEWRNPETNIDEGVRKPGLFLRRRIFDMPPGIPVSDQHDAETPSHPGGSGHYLVVVLEFRADSKLVANTGVNMAAVCIEQALAPKSGDEPMEAWPTEAVVVRRVEVEAPPLPPVPAHMTDRDPPQPWVAQGLWAPVELEIANGEDTLEQEREQRGEASEGTHRSFGVVGPTAVQVEEESPVMDAETRRRMVEPLRSAKAAGDCLMTEDTLAAFAPPPVPAPQVPVIRRWGS